MLNQLLRLTLKPLRHSRVPGIAQAAKTLTGELRIGTAHERSCRKLEQAGFERPYRIHLGCGPNPKPGWINVDLEETADYRLDVRREWPFEDDSTALIYSEHLFEHLDYPGEAQFFLREALRVLQPGGVLSTGVPPTSELLVAYTEKDDELFRRIRERWHPDWCKTPLDSINYHFRQDGEHRYAYDLETLTRVLAEAGFTQIAERGYDPDLDSELRRDATLYVDAKKP